MEQRRGTAEKEPGDTRSRYDLAPFRSLAQLQLSDQIFTMNRFVGQQSAPRLHRFFARTVTCASGGRLATHSLNFLMSGCPCRASSVL